LDILNFQGAQKVTLRQFLLTYSQEKSEEMEKQYFPYHKLQNLANLHEGLPNFEDFFDPIKEINQLDEPFFRFQQLINKGFSETKSMEIMKVNSRPLEGRLLYKNLRQKWEEAKINNMLELSKYYCSYDIKPLLKVAINFFQLVFNDTGICAQKDTLSLPQLAKLNCMKLSGMRDNIYLLPQKWHFKFAASLTGGISDVVLRRHTFYFLKLNKKIN